MCAGQSSLTAASDNDRLLIERSGASLRITILAERWAPSFLFLGLFAIWPIAGIAILYKLWSSGLQDGEMPPFTWLLVCLLACGWAVYSLFWLLTGRETITLEPTQLTYERRSRLSGTCEEYSLADITNLRMTAIAYADLFSLHIATFCAQQRNRYAVSIDYAGRTRRIAMALPEADAKLVVQEMRTNLTSLGR